MITRMEVRPPVCRMIETTIEIGEYPHPFRQSARDEKNTGSRLSDAGTKAPLHQLIGGEHLALKILWKKQCGDDHASEQIPEYDLKENVAAGV